MTEKTIRRDINTAEKTVKQLQAQHTKLKRLAESTSEKLAKVAGGDPNDIMEARIRRDTAREMLTENEREQQTTQELIEDLTAQAEQANLEDQHQQALAALEAAKGEWRKAATGTVRALKAILEEQEEKRGRISDAFNRVTAAAAAAGVQLDHTINARINWGELPGVTPHGVIETEHMAVQPPLYKTELAVQTLAANDPRRAKPVAVKGGKGYDPNQVGGARPDYSPAAPSATVSLKTMGLVK